MLVLFFLLACAQLLLVSFFLFSSFSFCCLCCLVTHDSQSALEAKLEHMQGSVVRGLEVSLQEMERTLHESEAETREARQEHARTMEQHAVALTAASSTWQTKLDELTASSGLTVDQLQKQVTELTGTLAAVQGSSAANEAQWQSRWAALTTQHEALQASSTAEVATLSAQCQAREAELVRVRQERTACDDSIAVLTADVQALRDTNDSLQRTQAVVQEFIASTNLSAASSTAPPAPAGAAAVDVGGLLALLRDQCSQAQSLASDRQRTIDSQAALLAERAVQAAAVEEQTQKAVQASEAKERELTYKLQTATTRLADLQVSMSRVSLSVSGPVPVCSAVHLTVPCRVACHDVAARVRRPRIVDGPSRAAPRGGIGTAQGCGCQWCTLGGAKHDLARSQRSAGRPSRLSARRARCGIAGIDGLFL
jgi:hypothetical protein